MSKEQGAGFYRFKVGEFDAASVSDGFLQFESPKTMIAAGASDEEFEAFMESKFLPSTTAYFQINSLYIDTGKHKVLSTTAWGHTLGQQGDTCPITCETWVSLPKTLTPSSSPTHIWITY